MIDVETFVRLPFRKQLHICILKWLQNQKITPFCNGKPVPKYFVCRAVLLKLDRQTIKNIALMLDDAAEPVSLDMLVLRADQFIRQRQSSIEQAKCPARKEYRISVADFLNR